MLPFETPFLIPLTSNSVGNLLKWHHSTAVRGLQDKIHKYRILGLLLFEYIIYLTKKTNKSDKHLWCSIVFRSGILPHLLREDYKSHTTTISRKYNFYYLYTCCSKHIFWKIITFGWYWTSYLGQSGLEKVKIFAKLLYNYV